MRRSLITLVGALAAVPVAAGCSTAVSGSPTHGGVTPTTIPGHVYTIEPRSSGAPSTGRQPRDAALDAACPLLSAATVGTVFGRNGVEPVEKRRDEPGVHACWYEVSGGLVASLSVRVLARKAAGPDQVNELFGKIRNLCTSPERIPGLGPHSVVCRLKKHPREEAGYVGRVVGDRYVLVSLVGPAGDGAAKSVGTLVRAIVDGLPGQ